MSKFLKGMFIGITMAGVFAASVPVLANVDVIFNKIKVVVNGTPVSADNVLINGRTYVPLRAISEILNKDVAWDEKTATASINDKDYQPISQVGLTRNNPAPLNTPVICTFKDGYDDNLKPIMSKARITVKEVLRGDTANKKILEANMFNKAPESGFDYLLAKIEFELLESKEMYQLYSSSAFKLISSAGKEYEWELGTVSPEPKLDTKLYSGAKHEGYAVFSVELTDSTPLITFGRDYDGNGGAWFKTN